MQHDVRYKRKYHGDSVEVVCVIAECEIGEVVSGD